jgi:hypothetical protein
MKEKKGLVDVWAKKSTAYLLFWPDSGIDLNTQEALDRPLIKSLVVSSSSEEKEGEVKG